MFINVNMVKNAKNFYITVGLYNSKYFTTIQLFYFQETKIKCVKNVLSQLLTLFNDYGAVIYIANMFRSLFWILKLLFNY